MNINLRKANALQLAIKQAIKETEVKTTVTISRFDNPLTKHSEARAEHEIAVKKKDVLVDALYAIRKLTAQAGTVAGVSDVLADIAEVDEQIGVVKPLADIKEFAPKNDEVLQAQFDDMKNEQQGQNVYHRRRDSIDVCLIHEADNLVKVLADLRLKKQKLSDDLLERNVKTEITLTSEIVITLKKFNLV